MATGTCSNWLGISAKSFKQATNSVVGVRIAVPLGTSDYKADPLSATNGFSALGYSQAKPRRGDRYGGFHGEHSGR